MEKTILYHGSNQLVEIPALAQGRIHNDYGPGFYCTMLAEMAREWACKNQKDGFINRYELDMDGLRILDFTDENHTVLNWISILLKNRIFRLGSPIAISARDYLIEHFAIDTSPYDVIIGYRADDSYFQYAEAFVENALPLRSLNQALMLGKLGLQTVLVSEKAFEQIRFVDAEPVDKSFYYPRFFERDTKARQTYIEEIAKNPFYREDIFVMDILREEMKNNDPRIQRIVLK